MHSPITRRRWLALLPALALFGAVDGARAAQPQIKQYQVEARYLNGFTKFIQWPASALPSSEAPLRLCVMGDNPFGQALDIIVGKHNERTTRQSNPQEVRYLRRGSSIDGCHVLYISASEESYLNPILASVAGKPVLTVSGLDHFVTNGSGMIQFYTRDNKVRFIIDPQNLRDAGLEPDANLLRAADIAK